MTCTCTTHEEFSHPESFRIRVLYTGFLANLLLSPGISLVLAPWIGTKLGYGPEHLLQIAAYTALVSIPAVFLLVHFLLPKGKISFWEAHFPASMALFLFGTAGICFLSLGATLWMVLTSATPMLYWFWAMLGVHANGILSISLGVPLARRCGFGR